MSERREKRKGKNSYGDFDKKFIWGWNWQVSDCLDKWLVEFGNLVTHLLRHDCSDYYYDYLL
jgi:hypothetical protein